MTTRAPLTAEQRLMIVNEARSWIRTRYHHHADVKGAGVDCAMLLVRIYCDLKIAPPFDPRPYAPQWYLNRDEERYIGWLEKYCDRIEEPEVLPGDIALYRYGRCAAHGAIVVDDALIIHAYAPSEQVSLMERRALSERIDSYWTPRNFS